MKIIGEESARFIQGVARRMCDPMVATSVRSVKRELNCINRDFGIRAEQKLGEVLESLGDRKPEWILGWKSSEKHSPTDKKGIDWMVFTDRGRICIQVKSCVRQAMVFERHFAGSGIVPVVINLIDSDEVILAEILEILSREYSGLPPRR